MAFDKKSLDGYVEVNQRIIAFYEKFPEGSIQSEIVSMTDALVVVKAYAYRNDSDPKPGIGHSSLGIPGFTPYTKGSELENAETSAWGRALAALGFEVKRGIASANEIANKRTEPPLPAPASPKPTVAPRTTGSMPPRPDYVSELQFQNLEDTAKRHLGEGNGTFKLAMWCKEFNCDKKTTTREQWKTMMEWVVNGEPEIREPGDESQEDLEAGFRASIDGDESWKNQHPKGDNMDLTGEQLSQDLDAALGTVNQAMDRVGQQSNDGTKISVAQGRRLFAIAKGNKQLLKTTLADFGFASDRDIPWKRYEEVCKAVEDAVREAGASA